MSSPQEEAPPSATAEIMQAFMQYPVPLALLGSDGGMLLVNPAFKSRYGTAAVVKDAPLDRLQGEGAEVTVGLHVPGVATPQPVRLRPVKMPDRTLLLLDEAPEAHRDEELARLRERVSMLEKLAATDHLTGAWNRSHFQHLVAAELERSTVNHHSLALVLMDIDHFKHVNDTFGHSAGDLVLKDLVVLAQQHIRPSDVLFRWGGEEFAVLVSSSGYRGAQRVAESLRAATEAHQFDGVGKVTISLGVAEHVGDEPAESWFKRLDAALYAAKEGGRNRVVVDRRGNSDVWASQPGTAVLHLRWQEAYESGNTTIDGEHKAIFKLANVLMDAAVPGNAQDPMFRQALDALLTHTAQHFRDEEAILARCHYVDLAKHKRAHDGLLARAAYLRKQLEAGQAGLGDVVAFLAQDVVARHLLVLDRAFFPLFQATSPSVAQR